MADSDVSIVNLNEATSVAVSVVAGDLPSRVPYGDIAGQPEGVGLVADPGTARGVRARYESAKGGRLGVVGTSIDVGSGGDVANPNAVGRNSNGSPWTHLSLGSNGVLEIIKNGAVGGLTLGGIGVVMTEAPIGSDHIDVAVTRGPCLPFNTETLFVSQNNPSNVEALYQTSFVDITGGRRVQFLSGTTTKVHHVGDTIGWGMIGRFEGDWAGVELDFMIIGGPINNVGKPGWTPANIALGQQVLAEMALERRWTPVLNTITPASVAGDRNGVDDANRAIRNSIRAHRHLWADMFSVLVNPADRSVLARKTSDGLHPNQEGAESMAAREQTQVFDRVQLRPEPRRAATADGDLFNKLPNPSFSNGKTTDAWGDLPTGWARQTFFSSGISTSIVEPRLLDHQLGNLIRVTANSGKGTAGIKYAIPVGDWVPGDKIYLRCFARLWGFKPDGFCSAQVMLNVTGNLGSVTHACGPFTWIRDYGGGVFNAEHTIDPAVGSTITALDFQIVLACPPLAGSDVGFGNLEVGTPYAVSMTRQDID